MTTTHTADLEAAVLALKEPSSLEIRPRYEGSNICTWIGFKHVNYLVEEAVLNHLRQAGLAPGTVYEVYGLCTDIVDIDTRILHAFHIDDTAVAEVKPHRKAKDGELLFAVTLHVRRETQLKAVTSTVRVQLRLDPRGGGELPVPAALAPFAVDRLAAEPGWTPEPVEADLAADDLVKELTAGKNAYAWKFRIPYWYCHFTERQQMSGYLRLMEEAKDRLVADRGVSIKTLLDEQNWIPVVPHSRITVLDGPKHPVLVELAPGERIELFEGAAAPAWTPTSCGTGSWCRPPPGASPTGTPSSRTGATGPWSPSTTA